MNIFKEITTFVLEVYYHTPKEILNDEEISLIKSNGLIHFCEGSVAKNIVEEGVKGNMKKAMRKAEIGYTCFYINSEETFNKNVEIIHHKGQRDKYDSYVVIKDLEITQIEKMRIRRKSDGAVIYPGNLHTKNMKAYLINNKI